jgi:hypothetical protein
MTANYRYLHLKVGLGFPIDKMEEGPIRERAIRFYWDIFQLLNKDPGQRREAPQARVLRLSFEDDFDEDSFENDDFDEDVFIPGGDLFKEEDGLFEEDEEEGPDFKDELYYK